MKPACSSYATLTPSLRSLREVLWLWRQKLLRYSVLLERPRVLSGVLGIPCLEGERRHSSCPWLSHSFESWFPHKKLRTGNVQNGSRNQIKARERNWNLEQNCYLWSSYNMIGVCVSFHLHDYRLQEVTQFPPPFYNRDISGWEKLPCPELDSRPASWDGSSLSHFQACVLNHLLTLTDEAPRGWDHSQAPYSPIKVFLCVLSPFPSSQWLTAQICLSLRGVCPNCAGIRANPRCAKTPRRGFWEASRGLMP